MKWDRWALNCFLKVKSVLYAKFNRRELQSRGVTTSKPPFYVMTAEVFAKSFSTHCTSRSDKTDKALQIATTFNSDTTRSVCGCGTRQTAGVEPFTAARRQDSARCVFGQSGLKHLEPDLNHLKMGGRPYNMGKTPFYAFFSPLSVCLFPSHASTHTDRNTHTHTHTHWALVGPSNPIPLYPLSCGLGSTCL